MRGKPRVAMALGSTGSVVNVHNTLHQRYRQRIRGVGVEHLDGEVLLARRR